ncbi:hypothetical protein LTR95_003383 [Oleoguttula sp. CCFEE 5521]
MSGRGRGRGGYGEDFGQQFTPFSPRGYRAVEDIAATQREDTLLDKAGKDTAVTLPRRPAYGSQGQRVLLWTNYFRWQIEGMTLYRYTVGVKKGGKDVSRGLMKRVIQLLIEGQLKHMRIDAVSDFRSTLISRKSLNDDLNFDIIYRAEESSEPEDDATQYQVLLEPSGTLNMSELVDYSTSTTVGISLSQSQELLQALNVIIGHASRIDPNTVTIGRNRRVSTATDQPRLSLGGSLEALRAFVFSARAATERVLINVQVKNLPFLVARPLTELISAFRSSGGARHTLGPFLRLVSVEVTHIQRRGKSNNAIPRYKTICGLAQTTDGEGLQHPPRVPREGAGAREVEFWLEESTPAPEGSSKQGQNRSMASEGRYTTVYDFFRIRHNVTIADPSLPVVNVGTSANPSYLPLQVCNVRPGQLARGQINPRQTAEMIKFALRPPSANAKAVTTVALSLLRLERNDVTAFDLKVQPQLLVVPGRRLPAPQLSFAQKKTTSVVNARWDLRDKRLLKVATMSNWRCLYITAGQQVWSKPADLQTCLNSFVSGLRGIGIQCAEAPQPELLRVDAINPSAAISQRRHELAAKKPSIVLVIIPASTGIYNAVKYSCDVQEGVLCQCVVDSKFAKQQTQYYVNVGLKVNLKLGGVNHSIPDINFGRMSPARTMFVGLDVTHPSPGSASSAPSVASIVSSVEETIGQWPAASRVQEARKEMITDLTELVQGQLRLWQSKNRTLPTNLVLYRDGVSEGQYQTVLDHELPAIKKAISSIYSPMEVKQGVPRLLIIIVGKRHHTRFYPTKADDADKTGNSKHGLVVDRGVTNFCNWDFPLQAHSALHGTAKPAHYYVIYDEVLRRLNPDQGEAGAADALEKMTHGLCYLFGRATSAVSVCPPAYYADLVCERARCYLSQHFAPSSGSAALASEPSGSTGVSTAGREVALHDAIKSKMFYI